jgi:hypothetical protein
MIDDVALLIRRLPEPAPPSSLAASVMARVAREPEHAVPSSAHRSPVRRDPPFAVPLVAGAAVGIGVGAYRLVVAGAGLESVPPTAGPSLDLLTFALIAMALLVYLVGLFAPLRR